jgi:hypothetical protein
MPTDKQKEAYSRGYDRGNYAAAYENALVAMEPVETALELRENNPSPREFPEDCRMYWIAGFTLGVYSSCERHEVAGLELELLDEAIRWVKEHALDDHRD